MRHLGVISRGVRLPIISAGEGDLKRIIIDSLLDAESESKTLFKDGDIICITESIVARAENNYVTVDDIADEIRTLYGDNCSIAILFPIYSRNRFSIILKGIARAAEKIYLVLDEGKDEVGNDKLNPFTNVNIESFYKELVNSEKCTCELYDRSSLSKVLDTCSNFLFARCHQSKEEVKDIISKFSEINGSLDTIKVYSLSDICKYSDRHGYNLEYGVLGSNKATEESLKLFPKKETCKKLCEDIQKYFKDCRKVNLEVMVYGDGCFKDPVGNIWEFADPVVAPYYTEGLRGTPNEVKIKYIADNESSEDSYVIERIKSKERDLKGKMLSQGTTPRRYCDLVGSLADLTSGSGDKGTPVIWISNYFDSYINN